MTYIIKLAYMSDELVGFLNDIEKQYPTHEIVTVLELVARLPLSFLVIVKV